MKKIVSKWLLCNFIILICIINVYGDTIPMFLNKYIDGKKTGEVIYLEISVYIFKNKTKWFLNQVEFSTNDIDKITVIQVMSSHSDTEISTPVLKEVKWEKGKYFECIYNYGWPIKIKMRKVNGTKYGWEIEAKGQYEVEANGIKHIIEYKGTKELNLKYKKIKMVNLYYN